MFKNYFKKVLFDFIKCKICLILFVFPFVVSAQIYKVEPGPKQIAIKAKNLLNVRTGLLISNPVVLIENGRIKSVGSNLSISKEFTVIDLKEETLLPGLIDCHTHLLHNYNEQRPNALNETSRMSTAKRALMGTMLAREMLEAGFTTVRDLGNCGINGDVDLRDAINFGWVIGPRMIVSTQAISPLGGQFGNLTPGAQSIVEDEYKQISNADEARKAVDEAVYAGANCIKIIANSGMLYLSLEEIKTIVDEAHRLGLKVAAHATGGQAIRNSIEAGVNSIEHAYDISDDELKMMVEKKIFLVPTDEHNVPEQQQRLARAIKAGVLIAAGSDTYSFKEGKSRGQVSLNMFDAYVAAGMTPLQAIQSATINAAALTGFEDFIGFAIEVGRPADIIAVKGDILNNIAVLHQVGFVMKDGQVYIDKYSK